MTTLSKCQEEALIKFEAFLINPDKEFILSGFSGVGKTYITERFLEILDKRNKFLSDILNQTPYNLALTATTNKAVRVLKDVVVKLNISVDVATIHTFLKLTVRKDFKTGREFLSKTQNTVVHKNTIVFIDEASYADDELRKIVHECFYDSKIVWIGDRDQLLSVGYELSPVLDNHNNPNSVHMITPQRNQGDINKLAHAFRNVLYGADWPVIKPSQDIILLSGPDFKDKVETMFKSQDYYSNPDYVKILGWTNKKTSAYNAFIRKLYTATDAYVPNEYLTSNTVITSGDAVLLGSDSTLKIKDVSEPECDQNGVTCQKITFYGCDYVLLVPLHYEEVSNLLKMYSKNRDWYPYFTYKAHYADMRPSHASTVHKSQGSTYENIFIDLNDIGSNNKPREVARLLYVAISRAKSKVYIYGSLPEKYQG